MTEYGEYVCRCEILHTGIIAQDGSMVNQWEATHKLEEIVRCHDCKYFKTNGFISVCNHFCIEVFDSDEYGAMRCAVEPDGFCAWGKRI